MTENREKNKSKLIRMHEQLFYAIEELFDNEHINTVNEWGEPLWKSHNDLITAAVKKYINEKKGEKNEPRYF